MKFFAARATAGDGFGLSMTLSPFKIPSYAASCYPLPFKVHSPNDHPTVFNLAEFTSLYRGGLIEVLVTPKVIITDKSLKSLSPVERQCYFENEMKLKYFKIYTAQNCKTECISDQAFAEANCVPFYYPRNSTMKVCNLMERNFAHRKAKKITISNSCDQCLQLCNEITYETETRFRRLTDKSYKNS